MTSELLRTILQSTYSRSDLAYRISVIRELLEFTFYTRRQASVQSETIDAFLSESKRSPAEGFFIRALPHSFFATFTPENIYTILDTLTKESKQVRTFSLTVPVVLGQADVDAIGGWVRQEVAPDLLVDIDIDPRIGAGCRFVWDNRRHNYSFEHYVAETHATLTKELLGTVRECSHRTP